MDDGNGQQVLPFKVSTYMYYQITYVLQVLQKKKLKFSIDQGWNDSQLALAITRPDWT